MSKLITILSVVLLMSLQGFAQTVIYGNNKAAGSYYNIRGIKMYAEVYGKGAPILLLHGNGGSIKSFDQTIPYFAKHYKVIAVDSRAHGKTVDTRDSLSFEMMADDFSALLDEMHIKACYVIGWSDGGIGALLLAMRHPDKVIKLAATGANVTPDSTAFAPGMWKGENSYYNKERFIPSFTEKSKNDWKIFMLDYKQPNIPFNSLKNIKCPSLIICGDHDLISLSHTTKIYQHIPQAHLWVVPNSGHATLREHKDEFNKTVENFFKNPFHKN